MKRVPCRLLVTGSVSSCLATTADPYLARQGLVHRKSGGKEAAQACLQPI
jgi:hypothetical protein